MPLFSCFGGGHPKPASNPQPATVAAQQARNAESASALPVASQSVPAAAPQQLAGEGLKSNAGSAPAGELSDSARDRSASCEPEPNNVTESAKEQANGSSVPADPSHVAGTLALSSDAAGTSEEPHDEDNDGEIEDVPGDGQSPLPQVPRAVPMPGCYTHSLKLTSEQTLCQSNIQLCRPEVRPNVQEIPLATQELQYINT